MKIKKKLKTEVPCDPAAPLLGMYPKEWKQDLLVVALFTRTEAWKHQVSPWTEEKDASVQNREVCAGMHTRASTHALWSTPQPPGRRTSCRFLQQDGPRGTMLRKLARQSYCVCHLHAKSKKNLTVIDTQRWKWRVAMRETVRTDEGVLTQQHSGCMLAQRCIWPRWG